MHQNQSTRLTLLCFSICFILFCNNASAQSIVLRPGIGKRYVHSKPDGGLSNNFDASFNGDYKLWEPTANIAVELMYPLKSFELVFTSQLSSVRYYSNFKSAYMTDEFLGSGGIVQFQLFYNKFFDLHWQSRYALKPFVGAGVGLGLNRPQSFYDSNYWKSRSYSAMFPDEYIDFLLTYKSLSKLSYSLAIKAGVGITIKKIERARLQLVYNLGLNKMLRNDIVYYHTNKKYWVGYTSRGSQFSMLLTLPIYLKRERRNE